MFVPNGDSLSGPAWKPISNRASGAKTRGSHEGGEQVHCGRMGPPQPAQLPSCNLAVKFCNHIGSTITSSSMNASNCPQAASIPLLRACDLPASELLSTTRTSQPSDSGTFDIATLPRLSPKPRIGCECTKLLFTICCLSRAGFPAHVGFLRTFQQRATLPPRLRIVASRATEFLRPTVMRTFQQCLNSSLRVKQQIYKLQRHRLA